jgi:hypothetical protein
VTTGTPGADAAGMVESRTERTVRSAAVWGWPCAVGAVGYLVATLVPLAPPGREYLAAGAALLLVCGPIGLLACGAAGPGRVGRAGLVAAAAGWVVNAVAMLVTAAVAAEAVGLYVVATVLLFAGMVAAGIAVVRAGRWSGWARWTPLVCGLYLLPAAPFFGRDDIVAALAIGGWMLPWLGVGAALVATSGTRS